MTHLTTPLPGFISAGSEGWPSWLTEVGRLPSGGEQRNGARAYSLREFNLSHQIQRVQDLYAIVEHFEVCRGQLHTFPFKDRHDYKSCAPLETISALDCPIGTGDGTTAVFQLKKRYLSGSDYYDRTILLPKSGTLLVAVAGVTKTETTHYTVDYLTGLITFTGGNIPSAAQAITAGYEFYCKVRFNTDTLRQVFESYRVGSLSSIPLIEVLS
jgi:uncharacterized protein (TIGR02217 family)